MSGKRKPSAADWASGVPAPTPSPGIPGENYDERTEPDTGAKPVPKREFALFKKLATGVNLTGFVALMGTAFGGYRALGADIEKQIDVRIDGGMRIIDAKVDALKQAHEALVDESRRNQRQQDKHNEHTDKALEVIMDRLGVAESKRPEPVKKDGGK